MMYHSVKIVMLTIDIYINVLIECFYGSIKVSLLYYVCWFKLVIQQGDNRRKHARDGAAECCAFTRFAIPILRGR
jgi:hypothetical protein